MIQNEIKSCLHVLLVRWPLPLVKKNSINHCMVCVLLRRFCAHRRHALPAGSSKNRLTGKIHRVVSHQQQHFPFATRKTSITRPSNDDRTSADRIAMITRHTYEKLLPIICKCCRKNKTRGTSDDWTSSKNYIFLCLCVRATSSSTCTPRIHKRI